MSRALSPSTSVLPPDLPARGLLGMAERRRLPDALVRVGIRRLCAARLKGEAARGSQGETFTKDIEFLRNSRIAVHTDDANQQHYELPPEFFRLCLGPRLKYSACYYPTGEETLAEAEDAMLALCAERAELADGQEILELGCGWGSMTLWMAQRYPSARITAVSNSRSQGEFIRARCQELELKNVRIITCDINYLEMPPAYFDRCVSIEMFEHMRNYEMLLARISSWLRPSGKLFVHIFCHRVLMYPFEAQGEDNWLGRYFFTGGIMPAADTLLWFQQHLALEERWLVNGSHYQRTAEDWLRNQDRNVDAVWPVLRSAYGVAAKLWLQRWRMFWMACSELFGYAEGQEWLVAHYRFAKWNGH